MFFASTKNDEETVVDLLSSSLRKDIAFGTLLPDQKLKLNELRSKYGGSNHSMREALRLLSAEGLVEATAQRGFRVTSATENDLKDIFLVRVEIETIALTRAIELGGIDWEGYMIAAHHGLQKAESVVASYPDDLTALEWDKACSVFAKALLQACDSPRLLDLHGKFFDQSRRYRLALLREGKLDWEARKARQRALLDSVLARDTATAVQLLRQDIEAELKSA